MQGSFNAGVLRRTERGFRPTSLFSPSFSYHRPDTAGHASTERPPWNTRVSGDGSRTQVSLGSRTQDTLPFSTRVQSHVQHGDNFFRCAKESNSGLPGGELPLPCGARVTHVGPALFHACPYTHIHTPDGGAVSLSPLRAAVSDKILRTCVSRYKKARFQRAHRTFTEELHLPVGESIFVHELELTRGARSNRLSVACVGTDVQRGWRDSVPVSDGVARC